MAQEIFRRYEKKYMLSPSQYEMLMQGLKGQMTMDEHGQHRISNIYFDTADFELIRQSIEKPNYKEKVRLRAYGTVNDSSEVYIEIKKKYDGIVYKRRIALPMEEAINYLYYGIRPHKDSQILKEIDYDVTRYHLKPKAYVSYDRIAFFGNEDPELRVTFDRNISCRSNKLDLAVQAPSARILKEGQTLMEVKIPGAMPLWMSHLFSELKIFPVSYSKYGTYYKEYLSKELAGRRLVPQGEMVLKGGLYCA